MSLRSLFLFNIILWISYPANAYAFFFALPLAAQVATIAFGALSAASAVFQGIQANKQAKAEAAQLDLNAKLERTAQLQRDTQRREELRRTASTIEATRGAGFAGLSPTAQSFATEASERLTSDRLVEFANSAQRQSDLRNQARNTRIRGRQSLLSGAFRAGVSLFQTASNVGGGSSGRSTPPFVI